MNIKDLVYTAFGYGEIINIYEPERSSYSQQDSSLQNISREISPERKIGDFQHKLKDKKGNKIISNA